MCGALHDTTLLAGAWCDNQLIKSLSFDQLPVQGVMNTSK